MKDNSTELFPVVDARGHVTGKITRGEAHNGCKVLHPVVHLHLFNSQGELYLQRRPDWKDIQPGKWDTACGGHIDYGETPAEALRREVGEELGITGFRPLPMGMYVFESAREKELVYVNRAVWDGEVKPSATELDGGRFWSRQEILENIGTGVFTPNFESEYQRFLLPLTSEPDVSLLPPSGLQTAPIVRPLCGVSPVIPADCFIAENAAIIGQVTLGHDCSIWYGAVLRGDVNTITLGDRSNVQDNATVHVSTWTAPAVIGNDVTIGHNACVHGCTIHDGALIGMGSTVLDHAEIGEGAIVAAGALVLQNTQIGPHEIWAGVPAKFIKKTEPGQAEILARHYIELKGWYE